MARSKTRTILSLDRYSKIMGINPVFFSGGGPIELLNGNTLFPISNSQNDIWPQYSWQNFDQVSREDLALELKRAEDEVIAYLGYSPVPIWTVAERHALQDFYRPDYQANNILYNVSGEDFELKPELAHFIKGGVRNTTHIGTVNVVYSDPDGDGWSELATITVTTTFDPHEVKLYFVGYGSDPTYEIRDPKTKTVSGGTIVFKFFTWQMIDPEKVEYFPTEDANYTIDLLSGTNVVATVNAYREYTDDTQPHAIFYTIDTNDGFPYPQDGFIYTRGNGEFVCPVQANYDITEQTWVRYDPCISPDYVDLWYYSGMKQKTVNDFDDYLPNDFAKAIAYLATARLERVFYANNNATALAARLREDWLVSMEGQFKMPPKDASTNPFGSRFGEVEAWRIISRFRSVKRSAGAIV